MKLVTKRLVIFPIISMCIFLLLKVSLVIRSSVIQQGLCELEPNARHKRHSLCRYAINLLYTIHHAYEGENRVIVVDVCLKSGPQEL